jgi:hypothetical protein
MNTNMQNSRKVREAWQIAGDNSRTSGGFGVNAVDNALCNPIVFYKGRGMERFLTVDVFKVEGEPMHAIIYCPFCTERDPENARNMSLRICETNKKIDLDIASYPKFPGITIDELVQFLGLPNRNAARGVISIEAFGCTFEEEATENRGATGIVGGLISACCGWKVKIDNNIARDA